MKPQTMRRFTLRRREGLGLWQAEERYSEEEEEEEREERG
jgi:hypothetical protein